MNKNTLPTRSEEFKDEPVTRTLSKSGKDGFRYSYKIEILTFDEDGREDF